jgi:hypothetical protein
MRWSCKIWSAVGKSTAFDTFAAPIQDDGLAHGKWRYLAMDQARGAIRRIHEHRHGPQPTAHADCESLAHPLYGVSSKHGIDIFRPVGRDAAPRNIANGSGQVLMDGSGHFALRP